jgi:hypothetical protein
MNDLAALLVQVADRAVEQVCRYAAIASAEKVFGAKPERLAADTAYGTGKMLAWLLEKGITPHIPVSVAFGVDPRWRERANEIAWATLGVNGLTLAEDAPKRDFVGMPRLTVRLIYARLLCLGFWPPQRADRGQGPAATIAA